MRHFSRRSLAVALFAATAMTFATIQDADAFGFGRHGGSWGSYGGSYGSYGGSAGYYGGSWGSSGGSYGSWGGRHVHRVRYARRGWGSSGGSWGSSGGSWGSSGGSYGSYGGSSYGSSGGGSYGGGSYGGGSYGGTVIEEGTVIDHGATEAAPPAAPTPAAEPTTWNSNSGALEVSVPSDAVVYVNDRLTKSTGANRQYVSHGLKQGESYSYVVRAEYTRDGEPVQETKSIVLTAGERASLAFGTSVDSNEPIVAKPVETKVTLRVPADAKVTLAGSPTRQTGDVREFATHRLAAGETWTGYTVEVTLERDGETLTKQETFDLVAGEARELTFDFDGEDKLARR